MAATTDPGGTRIAAGPKSGSKAEGASLELRHEHDAG